jgi:nicotinate-nucleotide pyrophosphorylase (carboxylating)
MDDITRFLNEDLGEIGDITSNALFTNEKVKGCIFVKEDCVLAGMQEAEQVFHHTGATLTVSAHDGNILKPKTTVATVEGKATAVLSAERLALNILGRMSGIATVTRHLVQSCKAINPNVEIAATRKTTPGFRKYEKRAVEIGGGKSHRMGLYDAIMIKDNHLKIVGSIETAIKRAQQHNDGKIIEIEVETEKDALIAANHQVDVIMLDNFPSNIAMKIAQKIRQINPSIVIEVSGGITPKNITKYASYSDRISLGYITHTIRNIDFSLELI